MHWREIITQANPRHCRDASEVKTWHVSPAMPPLSPVPGEPGIQMTGALLVQLFSTDRCDSDDSELGLGNRCGYGPPYRFPRVWVWNFKMVKFCPSICFVYLCMMKLITFNILTHEAIHPFIQRGCKSYHR